jgi:hypothetical protein
VTAIYAGGRWIDGGANLIPTGRPGGVSFVVRIRRLCRRWIGALGLGRSCAGLDAAVALRDRDWSDDHRRNAVLCHSELVRRFRAHVQDSIADIGTAVFDCDRPLSRLVTLAVVPNGSVLLAAEFELVWKGLPLAIFLPAKSRL